MQKSPGRLRDLSKRPDTAFLDSNVFIYGTLENCNSRIVILLAQLGEFEVAVSELVIEEVERFFRMEVSRDAAFLARRFIESLARSIVLRENITRIMRELKGTIKERDLENLAAVRQLKISHLVSFDVDYEKAHVNEYITPKEFVKLFDIKPYSTAF